MRKYITFIYLIVSIATSAQSGFLQSYDLEEAGLTFHNILLVDDTLIICGKIAVEQEQQWGVLLVKMDTFGQVLDYRIHFDELNDNYSFEQGYQMIKTLDGGYTLVGQMFNRQFPVVIKLDVNGDLEWVQEYPDETVYDIRHWNIIETTHGFISTGVKQQTDDGYWDAFVMGTNQQGEKQWEFSYGGYGTWESLPGIQKINENEFLLSGADGITNLQVTDYADIWSRGIAIIIDTLGQVLWEWEGEQFYGNGSLPVLNKLYASSDGNWVNESAVTTIFGVDELAFQAEIVKRDTNFNVLWQTAFGEPTSWFNNFVDLAPSPDGGWVAAGQYVELLPMGDRINAAMIAKVSAEGDSLWSRVDTLFSHETTDSDAYLSGVVVLPSGSIIACGHVNKFSPDPGQSYGWLIKVDKDGCMEPGCNPLVNGTNLWEVLEGFTVFPNPVTDHLRIEGKGQFDVQLLDIHGRLLESQTAVSGKAGFQMSPYTGGFYFVRIKQGAVWLTKKVIKN